MRRVAVFGLLALLLGKAFSLSALAAPKKQPVSVANVRVQVHEGFGDDGGNRYATVMFDAQFNVKPQPASRLSVKAICNVNGNRVVDSADVQDTLKDADVGLTKAGVYASPFISSPLAAVPTSCDLTILFGKMFDKRPTILGEYCWTGSAVLPARCAK